MCLSNERIDKKWKDNILIVYQKEESYQLDCEQWQRVHLKCDRVSEKCQ